MQDWRLRAYGFGVQVVEHETWFWAEGQANIHDVVDVGVEYSARLQFKSDITVSATPKLQLVQYRAVPTEDTEQGQLGGNWAASGQLCRRAQPDVPYGTTELCGIGEPATIRGGPRRNWR